MEKGWKHKMATGGGVGKKGRYHVLGELAGKQPILYSSTNNKNDISKLVNQADKDLFDLTGKKHKIFVTDSNTDEQIYHYEHGGGVEGYENLSFVKPNLIKTSETSAFGNPDKLILNYNGKKIAQFYYNMRGYNSDFSLKNSDGVHWGFGGDKSKTRQLSDFKKALKEGFVFIKNYTFKDGGKMAKGGGLKLSGNVYKLRAEGLNDFLAFLQQGMYFRVKSFTVETTSGPDVVVSFKTDASLSEIKSKLNEVPDSHVMLETIKPIKEYTGERNEEYAKGGWVLVDSDTERKLGEYATESKAREMMYEYEGNSMIVKKSEWDKLPPNPNRHSPAFYFKQGGGVGTSSKLKYSLYLDRTVGDNVTTYHIADFAAKGDLSIALESLKAAAPKNYMYYTK